MRPAAWLLLALIAAPAPSTSSAGPSGGRQAPARSAPLAYHLVAGQTIRQTTRQVQQFRCASLPQRNGESVLVARIEGRVIEVHRDGTATIDEITRFEGDAERIDHRRYRMRPSGEVVSVDVLQGEPSITQGGAIFLDRPVQAGESWPTRMKGVGGSRAADLALTVTLRSLSVQGGEPIATIALEGRMDAPALNAMIGEAGAAQGIRGKECAVTGEIVFRVESGQEISSRLSMDCALEVRAEGKAPAPATLTLSYETLTEGSTIPSIPAP